jgi:anti-sigma B factor antagonist
MTCALNNPPSQRQARRAPATAVNGLAIDSTYLARDVICLDVSGDVDMASSEALNNALRGALTAPGLKRVLVDLSKVTFLDSTGINTLVQSHQQAGDQNINLQVVNPSTMALRVLDITGVLEFLSGDA